jgi:hypothetical protein
MRTAQDVWGEEAVENTGHRSLVTRVRCCVFASRVRSMRRPRRAALDAAVMVKTVVTGQAR